jgi:paraquat-inducible protein B
MRKFNLNLRERLKLDKFKSRWQLWFAPVIALVFCGYFLHKYFEERGVEIVVSFTDAKSVTAEKTRIFYRGVPVGVVNNIKISEDGEMADCYITLEKNAIQFARSGTEFYLISPKVSFEKVSGLETLLSGSYISLEPSKSPGEKQTKFKGLLSKNSVEYDENSSMYVLETDHAESITPGDNIFFKGLPIGVVGEVRLSKTAQTVLINVYIKNSYDRLIRTNTVFWKKPGIKADLGLFGSKIKFNSLDTILRGGIEIATPVAPGKRAKWGTKYPLLPDEPKDKEKDAQKWNPSLN